MEIALGVVAVVVVLALVLVLVVVRRRPARTTTGDGARVVPPRTTPAAPAGPFGAGGLGGRIRTLFESQPTDAWSGLEDLLIRADVGPAVASEIVERVRSSHHAGKDPVESVRREILTILGPDRAIDLPQGRLAVIVVVGVNGSGKTTTIGKLARMLGAGGARVSLAGADTFRAAAGEQLEVWANRAGAHLVAQDRGADPGAVAFDAVTSATARGSDVLIVDTAGRLHTKQPLMDELGKIARVIGKAGAQVDETLLVLDAQTGQNGIAQARAFTEAVPLTGVVLTKTDGSAKGGIVLAVRREMGVPIRLVGVGEGPDDLQPFRAEAFTDRLLASG
jgi:fused signal recognition particle receptor